MDHSLYIITIFRHYVLNYIKYTIVCHEFFVSDLFTRNINSYKLRLKPDFVIPQVRAVLKGSNSIRYYGPIIWSLVPEEIRYTDSLEKFKNKNRRWKPTNCPCRICKNYVPNVGVLEIFE